jgi:hypothetical protein
MSIPAYIQKTLRMKPEVNKIFDDLDKWLDHCRFELTNYDPKDLYKSQEYRAWQRNQEYGDRKYKKDFKPRWNNK